MVEAAASGKPVVSTNTAGAQEVIRHGETGFLCEIDSPGALAARIIELLGDPIRASEMGAAGQVYVLSRFDYEQAMEALIKSWRRAVNPT